MTWESYFLGLIGAPASESSVRVCDLWAASEGVLSRNNPFAVSGKYPGATVCIAQCGTASEVWAYDTIEHGCEAAANFLKGSYYAEVLTAFRTDAGEAAIWKAINTSPWCTGCQDGKYPIDLYNWVQANPPAPPQPQPIPTEDGMKTIWRVPNGGEYILDGGRSLPIKDPSVTAQLAQQGWGVVNVDQATADAWGMP